VLTQLNGKLYKVAKAQFDKSCSAMANGPAGSVVLVAWRPKTKPACARGHISCGNGTG